MRSLLERTLDLAFGAWALTREKVQEHIDELVRRGHVAREESGSLVEDILRRGREQREEIQNFVRHEVGEAVSRINIATREDIANLERRIQALEVVVNALRGEAESRATEESSAPTGSAPTPPAQ